MGLRLAWYPKGSIMPRYSVGWSVATREEAQKNAEITGVMANAVSKELFEATYDINRFGTHHTPLDVGAWLFTWEDENEFGMVSP